RNVKSAGFFEQMKGRGVRVMSPDKLRVVTPSARAKERFIVVDAVGVCEHDKTDSQTLNRQPSATLEQLLNYVAQGGTDPEAVTPFMKAAFRRRILEIRLQNEQVIDRVTIDEVLYAGFDVSAVEKAQTRVKDFRAWIDAHKAELTALQLLYAGTRPLRVSLKE